MLLLCVLLESELSLFPPLLLLLPFFLVLKLEGFLDGMSRVGEARGGDGTMVME